ncbi:MAG: RidA family protein [Myxococcales bacterium]|nr:RidA family protein [Myxococcales bacterium]
MKNIAPIATKHAPGAIGPYSQAIVAGPWVYCSGQIGLDPATGEMVPGTVVEEARRALANLEAVLDAAGSSRAKIVKTTLFLETMSDFAAVNEVYAEFFGAHRPARSTVAVSGLPKGAKFEIEAVAIAG